MPGWLLSLLEAETPLLFIVLLRLVIGVEFAAQGYDKFQEYFGKKEHQVVEGQPHRLEGKLTTWIDIDRPIRRMADDGARRRVRIFPWYQVFLEKAVIPNVQLFATLVTAAEIALGAMLILGLMVRVVAGIGILLVLNYLFATWHLGFPYTAMNVLFLAALLVFALASAGRCLGLDGPLHDRFPEIPFF